MVFGLFHSGKTGRFPSFLTLDPKRGYSYKMGLQHSGRIEEEHPWLPQSTAHSATSYPMLGMEKGQGHHRALCQVTTYTLSSKMTRVKRLRGRPLETAPSGLSLKGSNQDPQHFLGHTRGVWDPSLVADLQFTRRTCSRLLVLKAMSHPILPPRDLHKGRNVLSRDASSSSEWQNMCACAHVCATCMSGWRMGSASSHITLFSVKHTISVNSSTKNTKCEEFIVYT